MYIYFFHLFVATDLLEGAELKASDGILYFLLDQNIPIDVAQRIIVDFLLAAGDTVKYLFA